MNFFKEVLKNFILFLIGAYTYMQIEIMYRGFTHWTMGIVGGLCFIIIGGINNYYDWEMKLWKQCCIGAAAVTTLEFISGVILNIILKMNIWDYSKVPFNLFGQICLPFSLAWLLLSLVAIILDDFLRYFLFKEKFPHYNI